jgi:hypothetical protein
MNKPAAGLLLTVVLLVSAPAPAQTNAVVPFARGTIVKLDPKSGEMLLKTSKGERTYWLTPRTYIFRGEEKLTADKLKPGDYLKLRVTGTPTSQLNVVRIKVDTNTVPLPPLMVP